MTRPARTPPAMNLETLETWATQLMLEAAADDEGREDAPLRDDVVTPKATQAAAAGQVIEGESEFVDRLVHINRVATVVNGGKRFGFAALVVVGDKKGRAGFGHGKAREVPEAIRKATDQAKRQLIRVPLREARTLQHDLVGRHGAGKVTVHAAVPGTGIVAVAPMRAVFETLGINDVVAEWRGAPNAYNMVRATFDALKQVESARQVTQRDFRPDPSKKALVQRYKST